MEASCSLSENKIYIIPTDDHLVDIFIIEVGMIFSLL